MSENKSCLLLRTWLRDHQPMFCVCLAIVLISLAFFGPGASVRAVAEPAKHARVSGAGKTMIEGGTGGTAPLPVTTLVAFHADREGGDFECLAFAPSAVMGPESGEFDTNVMYVTGKVTSLETNNGVATLRGNATVTGLGAGQGLPFTAVVHAGGPGATLKLDVSGLTFLEILVDGQFSVSRDGED
jgi:hypothetical protein